MADKEASLILRFRDLASAGMKKLSSSIDGLKKIALQTGVAFGGLVAAGVLAVKSYAEQETAVSKLNLALKNQGAYSAQASQDLQDFANEMQRLTVFADDVVLEQMALLTTFGLTGDKLKETTKAAMDLSSAYGIDLRSATMLLGKAAVGETATLGKYGIVIEENIPKAEKFAAALAQIQQRFGGAAQEEAKTFAGSVANLKNAFSELMEQLGQYLLPLFNFLVSSLRNTITWVSGLSPAVKITAVAVGLFTTAILGTLAALGTLVAIAPTVATAWAIMTGPVGWVMGAIVGVGLAATALITDFIGLRTAVVREFDAIARAVISVKEAFGKLVVGDFAGAKQTISDGMAGLKNTTVAGIESITSAAKAKWEGLKQSFSLPVGAGLASSATGGGLGETAAEAKVQSPAAIDNSAELARLQKSAEDRILQETTTQEQLKLLRDLAFIDELEAAGLHEEAKTLLTAMGVQSRMDLQKKADDADAMSMKNKIAAVKQGGMDLLNLASKQSKELGIVAKGAGVANALINSYTAFTAALKNPPGPPWTIPTAAAALGMGLAKVAAIRATPLAQGGMITPRAGGVPTIMGEAGKAEVAIPLDDERTKERLRETFGGGTTININAGTIIADEMSVKDFAKKIDTKLFELQQNGQTVSI